MDSQNRQVYNHIANEFNNTRWIPWPCTQKFLHSLPQGSLDVKQDVEMEEIYFIEKIYT